MITLRNDLADYLGQVTIRQRTLANYVLIFMISDELQNENPHSWPVRMVPVTTVTKEIVETLREQLIEAMAKENMQIVGRCNQGWTKCNISLEYGHKLCQKCDFFTNFQKSLKEKDRNMHLI